jgi:hypothetical protein
MTMAAGTGGDWIAVNVNESAGLERGLPGLLR